MTESGGNIPASAMRRRPLEVGERFLYCHTERATYLAAQRARSHLGNRNEEDAAMHGQPSSVPGAAGPFRLYDRWPAVHLVIAAVVLVVGTANWSWVKAHPSWLWFVVVAIPIIAAHEWEEFRFPGGFRRWFNVEVCRSTSPDGPLTTKQAALNHVPLMLVFPLLAVVGARWPWMGLAALFSLVADAIFHISATILTRRYSPGTITAALLYLPAGVTAAYFLNTGGQVSTIGLIAAAISGVLVLSIFLFLPILLAPGTESAAPPRPATANTPTQP